MSDDITTDVTTAPTEPIPVAQAAEQFPPVQPVYPPAAGAPAARTPEHVAASNRRIATVIGVTVLGFLLAVGVFASGVAVGSHMGGGRDGFAGPGGRMQLQQGQGMMPGQGQQGYDQGRGGMRGGRGRDGGRGGYGNQFNQNGQGGTTAVPQTTPQSAPTAPGQ